MKGKLYELALSIAGKLDSSFAASFGKAERTLDSFDSAQQRLGAHKKSLDAIMSQTRSTFAASQAFNQAKARVEALSAQMKASGGANAQLKAQYTAAQAAVKKASAEYQKQSAVLSELKAKTGATGKSIAQMRAEQEQLAKSAARASAAQKAQAMAQSVSNVRSNAGVNFALGGAQLMAIKGMANMFAGPIKLGIDFDKTMSKVGAVSNASAEDLAKLRAQARELGATTEWSASEAASGMTYLAMAGFKTNDMLKAMPGMLSLASAGAVDLGTAADISSNILSGFGMKADEIGRVGDVMVNTFTNSNTSLHSLGEAMKYVAPVASNLGVSIEQTASMVGKLGDAGIAGSAAGTALRNVLTRLTKPSKTLSELGVSVKDANGNMKAMPEILADLNSKLSKFSEVDKAILTQDIFGQEAMSAAMVLMNEASSGSLQKFIDKVGEAGAAQRVARQQTDNLNGDIANLSSAWEECQLIISDAVQPSLRALTASFTTVLERVGAFLGKNKELLTSLAKGAMAVGGVVASLVAAKMAFAGVVWAVTTLISPIFAIIKAVQTAVMVFNTLKTVMVAVNAVMIANPIGLIVTAIGAAIAAGVLLWQNWDTVKEKCSALWNDLKDKFSKIVDFVTTAFTERWTAAWQNVVSVFGRVFNTLKDVAKAPINAVILLVNKAIAALNGLSFEIPDWIPGMGGKSFGLNIPEIPALASGGIATAPTTALIGEGAEPEAVLPLSKLESLMGGIATAPTTAQGVTLNFNPTINISGGNAYDQVQQALNVGKQDLKREIERYFNQRQRLSYG